MRATPGTHKLRLEMALVAVSITDESDISLRVSQVNRDR